MALPVWVAGEAMILKVVGVIGILLALLVAFDAGRTYQEFRDYRGR